MNWIDYTIFIILFFAAIAGIASGPILQFLRICSLLISFFAAIFFHDMLSNILKGIFTPATANVMGYFIVFGVALIATYIITDVVKRIMGKLNMGIGLRLFGGLLGILKGLFFCGVIILGVLAFCSKTTTDKVNASKVAPHVGKGMRTIVSIVPENVANKIKGYANEMKKKNLSKDKKQSEDEEFKPSQ